MQNTNFVGIRDIHDHSVLGYIRRINSHHRILFHQVQKPKKRGNAFRVIFIISKLISKILDDLSVEYLEKQINKT